MPKAQEITISPCPVCGGSHTYYLSVTGILGSSSEVMKGMSHERRSVGSHRVTKFLMCPVKQVLFQAVIELPDGFELSA